MALKIIASVFQGLFACLMLLSAWCGKQPKSGEYISYAFAMGALLSIFAIWLCICG